MKANQVFQCRKLAVAVAVAGAMGSSTTALAQEGDIEEITVTGSFLERPADRPQPVTVINNEQLQLEQKNSISEIFKTMPQVAGSVSTINTGEGGNSPTNTVNLRGLGARSTLVLLNGRRHTIDGNLGGGSSAVDIDNLAPSIMIDRVEVLTDGASALYGSDAVAGVVNFLTRDTFEGTEVRTTLQKIQDVPGGKPDMQFGIISGVQGVDGGIVGALEFNQTELMLLEDHYDEARLLTSLQSGFANPGSFSPLAGGPRFADPLCGDPRLGDGLEAGYLNAAGDQCLLVNSLGRTLQPESSRFNGMAVAHREFGNGIGGEFELSFARTEYDVPFGFVTPLVFPLPPVPANNPGVVAANEMDPSFVVQDYGWYGRMLSPADGRPTVHTTEQNTYRLAGALDGDFGNSGWSWNLSASWSKNSSFFTNNDTLNHRLLAALQGYGGVNCGYTPDTDPAGERQGTGDCQWFNPFANHSLASPGDPHYNDPALVDFIIGDRMVKGTAELRTVEGVVTGELWEMAGGTTGLAVGAQIREQDFSRDWDELTNEGRVGEFGWRFNQDAFPDFSGTTRAEAFFTELVMYPTEQLELQLAARYEDYGSMDSTDPKIGLLWTPTDNLFIRASAGTSFRRAGEAQLFGISSGGASTRDVGGETIQARGVVQGNQDLAPEESENWTLGFTWDVNDNLTLEMNYWDVSFENLVVSEDGDILLVNDMADGFIDNPQLVLYPGSPNEVCEVTGRWDGVDVTTRPADCLTGFDFQTFITSYVNQDYQETAGLDFTIDYGWSAFASEWNLSLSGTWTHKYDIYTTGRQFDGVGSYNSLNFGSPSAEWRGFAALNWRRGDSFARATWRFISELEEDDPALVLSEEDDFHTLDLVAGTVLPSTGIELTVSVINLLDNEDPIKQNSMQTGTTSIYDPRGRVYRVGLGWTFE